MTAPVFVDTNIFLYALDSANPIKQRAARQWRDTLWRTRFGRISFQVLQEFYANVATKWPAERDNARAEIRDLLSWRPLAANSQILEYGWRLQDRYRISFWDALIVAAAKSLACGYLLTENLQAGQTLDGIRVINPFKTPPSELSVDFVK